MYRHNSREHKNERKDAVRFGNRTLGGLEEEPGGVGRQGLRCAMPR